MGHDMGHDRGHLHGSLQSARGAIRSVTLLIYDTVDPAGALPARRQAVLCALRVARSVT